MTVVSASITLRPVDMFRGLGGKNQFLGEHDIFMMFLKQTVTSYSWHNKHGEDKTPVTTGLITPLYL